MLNCRPNAVSIFPGNIRDNEKTSSHLPPSAKTSQTPPPHSPLLFQLWRRNRRTFGRTSYHLAVHDFCGVQHRLFNHDGNPPVEPQHQYETRGAILKNGAHGCLSEITNNVRVRICLGCFVASYLAGQCVGWRAGVAVVTA